MSPRRAARLLPAALFVIAAAGLLAIGLRLLAHERAVAERTARARLQGRAREAAGLLAAAAARLIAGAQDRGERVAVWKDGRFVKPPEPRGIAPLRLPPGRDAEGEFYLAEAERAEARDGDRTRAEGLYRAALGPARDPSCRALARFRLAALLRRAGAGDKAAEARAAFLREVRALPDEAWRSREALFARALERPPDPALREDLLPPLGSGDDAIAQGLLADSGLLDPEELAGRRAELALMERLRPLVPGPADPSTGARIAGGRLVAWSRGEETLLAEGDLPALPEGTELLAEGASPESPDRIAEAVEAGPPLQGARVSAWVLRREVEEEADRRARLLGAALAALIVGGGAALLLAFRAARREAEASRARAAFLARVGHDLRTPLAVIRVYAETLAEGRVSEPAEAREFAAVAAREAERLSRLVGKVLDLSRVSAAAETLARKAVDLTRLVREVAAAHRPLLQRAGLTLAVAGVEEPVLVEGDEDALRGAVGNLLENALQHAASGGIVEAVVLARDGRAEVRVLDRGPGLPAEVRGRLFTRFVRGAGARPGGAGLGLALVREIAEAHGGSARAEDREGGGAVLTIVLPLRGAP